MQGTPSLGTPVRRLEIELFSARTNACRDKMADLRSILESVVSLFNSFSSAAEITRAKPTWYFAGSYLRFSACYVDENNTIRFSEKFPIYTYNKMSTL
jgi:hypothetical protein